TFSARPPASPMISIVGRVMVSSTPATSEPAQNRQMPDAITSTARRASPNRAHRRTSATPRNPDRIAPPASISECSPATELDTPSSSRNRGSDGPSPYRNQVYVHSVTIGAAEVASGRSVPSGSGVVAGGSAGSAMGSSSGCRVSLGTGRGQPVRPPGPPASESAAVDRRTSGSPRELSCGMHRRAWGAVVLAVSLIVAVALPAALGFGRQVAGAAVRAPIPGTPAPGDCLQAPL